MWHETQTINLKVISYDSFQYMEDIMFNMADPSPDVAQLVDVIWAEALGEVEEQLAVPIAGVTLQQVRMEELVDT